MISQDPAIRRTGLEHKSGQRWAVEARMRSLLTIVMGVAFALMSSSAYAATITVNSLADPGAPGICALRDAITAANSQEPVNGCIAGNGNDKINFSVSGTIELEPFNDLLISDPHLVINGPITITGGLSALTVESTATARLRNVTIEQAGGGCFVENLGTLTITNSNIQGSLHAVCNGIPESGEPPLTGTMVVTNSTFTGNHGDLGFGPGAIGNFGGTLTVRNSTFTENLDDAIRNEDTAIVVNSTFFNNRGVRGAGAIDNFGTLTVISSTFSDNNSDQRFGPNPGAILNGGSAIVKNSIFAGSTDGLGNLIANCTGTITDAGYNISDDDSCGFTATGSLNNTNPGLSSAGLANNGGPTQTIALSDNSPAIDAIPLADCTDQKGKRLRTDQRGFRRPDEREHVCDIGSFETQDGCSQNQQRNNNCE